MTPLKDCRTHSIVISKFFQRGFFILISLRTKNFTLVTSIPLFYVFPLLCIPSFMVAYVRYIINTYSIVNAINAKEALWHSTLRNAYKRSST